MDGWFQIATAGNRFFFLATALSRARVQAGRFRKRRTATLLATAMMVAVLNVPVRAQNQNPDFTNVDDILQGQRTLLQVTDVEIISNGPETGGGVVYYQLPTSDSSPGQTAPAGQVTNIGNPAGPFKPLELSGRIFNLPKAVTVQIGSTNLEGNYAVEYTVQNAGIDPDYNLFNLVNSQQSPTHAALADFNGDNYDDIFVEFDDGSYQVLTATDVNKVYVPFTQNPLKAGPAATTLDALSAFTAGDFDGNGQPEIAGLELWGDYGGSSFNHLGLVVYTVDRDTLQIQRVSSKPFVLTTPEASAANAITQVSIARGRFNTTTHDQVAVTFSMLSGPSIVEIVDFDPSFNPTEGPQLTVSNTPVPEGIYTGYIQVTTGKFALPDNSFDEIVFHQSSTTTDGDKFFEVISANPRDLTLTAHGQVSYSPCAAYNGLQVGNFDNQQANHQHNPNSQIALLACSGDQTTSVLNIYSVDPQSFDVHGSPDSSLTFTTNSPLAPHSTFVATDIQGRSMVLGEPTKVTISNTKPTIINAAPPMHVDYITPVNGTKPEVLNISFIPDGFNSSFSLSQDSKTAGSTTHQTSWSAGVAESGSASVQWGDVDKGSGSKFGVAFKAAQDFTGSTENSNNNYATTRFDVSVATKKGDQVFYDDSRLNIWVYPVIGQTACPAAKPACTTAEQQPLTLQFSGPDQIDTGIVSTEDAGSFWYQPPWEFGNVFSYPANAAQLALIYPELAQTQLSNDVSFKTNPSSVKIQASWGSGSERGSTSSTTDNFSFDGKTSFVVAAGVKGIGQVTTKESIKVTGSYGFGTLQTNTAQVDASTGIGITSTAIFPDTSNYGYKVTPYILGSAPPAGVGDARQPPLANIQTFGPLKTAFTADPIDLTLGGAWWTTPYSSAPDVALNHPNRWILTEPGLSNPVPNNCGNGGQNASQMDCVDIAPYFDDSGKPVDPWVSNFYSMRGLFITDADNAGPGPQLGFATAGDKINLAVRVYNYSLMPVVAGNHVHVRFYAMPVDSSNGNSLGNSFLIGESVVDPVPPFQDSTADLNWRVVQCPHCVGHDSLCRKIFRVLGCRVDGRWQGQFSA